MALHHVADRLAVRLAALAAILAVFFGLVPAAQAEPPRVEAPHVEVRQPALNLPGAIRGVHYASITQDKAVTPAALWGKDGMPKGVHVKQGGAGDCYLDATMAVYAQFHPQVIQKIFLTKSGDLRTKPDGTPVARYFEKSPTTGQYHHADPAAYNGDAPVGKDGKPVFTKVVHGATWMPMVETTFTLHRDHQAGGGDVRGWKRTGSGGYANHVMEAATGKSAELFNFKASDADQVWAKLKKAQDEDKVVVVGSVGDRELPGRAHDQVSHGLRDAKARGALHFDEKTWVGNHAHSLWGDKTHPFLVEKDGQRFIKIRNPWGSDPPGGVASHDEGDDAHGVGLVPFNEFMLRFSQGYIGASTAKN